MRFKAPILFLTLLLAACSNPRERAASFWDGYDFGSTEGFSDVDAASEKFGEYVGLLTKLPEPDAETLLLEFLDSASRQAGAYTIWAGWLEGWLHSVDSPFRNDALYRAALSKIVSDNVIDSYLMASFAQSHSVIDKVVAGADAPSLQLKGADGVPFNLRDFVPSRQLVYIADSGCISCLDQLSSFDGEYADAAELVRLVILVNASQETVSYYQSQLPPGRIVAYCPGREVERGEVFDLSMLPSRLLIGGDGRIEKTYF